MAPLKLGEKLSFFTLDSTYHGGRGEGFGRRSFTCGQYFEGRWKNDEQEGPGKLTTDAGSAYDGEWSNGKMHGQGKYTWTSGSTYEGQWKENMKHGKGRLTMQNAWYDGDWKKNQKHGWGVYQVTETTPFGLLRYEGQWDHDARTGTGIATGVDGHVELCRYDNGLRVGEGVRLMNCEALSRWDNEETGAWRMQDGQEIEVIDVETAAAIAKSLGLDLPRDPKLGTAPSSVARSTASSTESHTRQTKLM